MLVVLREDLTGNFQMPRKFPKIHTNVGVALAELVGENGWTGAGARLASMRVRLPVGYNPRMSGNRA